MLAVQCNCNEFTIDATVAAVVDVNDSTRLRQARGTSLFAYGKPTWVKHYRELCGARGSSTLKKTAT